MITNIQFFNFKIKKNVDSPLSPFYNDDEPLLNVYNFKFLRKSVGF